MQRLALGLGLAALVAAWTRAPGAYAAIGLGIAAIGTGWVGYARRGAPGAWRLVAAAAIAVGSVALVLGTLRVVLAIAALQHLDRMLGP